MNNQLEINSFITSSRFRNIAINVFSENIDQSDFGNLDNEDCDIVYKSNNKEHFSLIYKKNKLKIKSNSIVFCHTDYVEEFFSLVKKNSFINNLILITSQSDKSVNKKLWNRKPESISKWFAINSEVDNENLINIPLGLGNSFSKKNINIEDFNNLNKSLFIKEDISMLINFNVNTNFDIRNQLVENYKSKSWCNYKTNLSKNSYIETIKNSSFILCPPGNGPDTHRIWESLYLGSIPVVQKHNCFKGFEDLPILFVDDLNSVSFDLLNQFMQNLKHNDINLKKIDINYWRELISNNISKKNEDVEYIIKFNLIEKLYFSLKYFFRMKFMKIKKRNSNFVRRLKKIL